jgi:hypothetical protein
MIAFPVHFPVHYETNQSSIQTPKVIEFRYRKGVRNVKIIFALIMSQLTPRTASQFCIHQPAYLSNNVSDEQPQVTQLPSVTTYSL